MVSKFQPAERLSVRMASEGRFDSRQILAIIRQLTSELAAIHATGRLCRNIRADQIILNSDGARFAADELNLDSGSVRGPLPPEMQGLRIPDVPNRLNEAAAVLQKAGAKMDPRRIDIFQLGSVACQLLTGCSPKTYLYSPRVKASVPPTWRSVLDGMLGFDPAVRINSCDELAARIAGGEPSANAKQGGNIDTLPRVTTDTPRTPRPAAPILARNKLGHFEIEAKLGSGGMGDVYRAHDEKLDRTVALKVLPRQLARQPDFVRRFVEEAKAAARLVHPNIVQIHCTGEDRGHHYFAMQYVAGETLAERLQREKRLALDGALDVVEQVLSGLAIAHSQGMIHRDIKPGNILLDTAHGRALLADFGLVKSLDASQQMTATGIVMGTVDYISPEQGRGQRVDARSDLYSVGVLLYQMLSGQLPFAAESATAMIFQHAYEKPRPLADVAPDVPAGAVAIIDRLLAKNPVDRYQTADELLMDIRRLRTTHDWTPGSYQPASELYKTDTGAALAEKHRNNTASAAFGSVRLPKTRTTLIGLGTLAALAALLFYTKLRPGFTAFRTTTSVATTATHAAASPPANAILPMAGWFDVLPFVQFEKGTGDGVWQALSDGARLDYKAGPSHVDRFLEIPVQLRGSYEFKFKYLLAGDRHHGYTLRFPVGSSRAALTFGSLNPNKGPSGNKGLGINGIHGLDAQSHSNPTYHPDYLNHSGVEHDALLHVECSAMGNVHLQLSIDGTKEVDWSGNEADVRMLDNAMGTKLSHDPILILHSWGKSAIFRQLAVRMLDGWAELGPAAANVPTTTSPNADGETPKTEVPSASLGTPIANLPPVAI